MVNKVLLSFAMVGLFAATAKATDYEVVSTNAWFTAGGSTDSKWTATASGTTNWVEGTVTVDSAANDPLVYTPDSSTADGYRVTANVKFTRCASAPTDVPSYSDLTALGALAVTSNSWHGVNNNSWVPLYGVDVPENDESVYNVTLDFKTNGVQKLVRYTVGTTVLTNASGVAWLTRGCDAAGVTKVGIAGYGELASLRGDTVSYFELTVTSDALTGGGIRTEDAATIIADLNAEGANGLPRWESLVLGLNPMDANAKPYAAPVQTAGNTLGFTIGNVNTAKYGSVAEGATVTFDVLEKNNQGEWVEASGTATGISKDGVATVTPDSANVKYYKIKIKITK